MLFECAAALILLAAGAQGVVVDRIAVVVGGKIITQSEIEQRIRLTALQNHEKPDFGTATRRKTAEQLIDQKLVEREMEVGRYPRIEGERKKALLAEFEKGERGLAQTLESYRLKAQDLEEDLGRQADLLTFLNLRFRPAVQVTDQDVQKYFDTVNQGAPLNEVRAQIEQKLTEERADKELDLWLRDQRKRTRIEYLEKDLEAAK
jgi:parvulin-like peptidyl-prolyl isomerase